ncbi:Pimeloyl-ACP methyl ester carboxylesterase [Klenkia soli]|uniref:Pimeloyl-ACP methyl ester carboxylesterase n=1 Tax=Klenkia soli TaxID=1052260 RepID=A0A1H0JD39_9ACTN|nr:alpha/beta hydrolase [Klenkia soli]SDO41705.1 Pimeloyl-ACP methyl ester carboxylesterase [Klenkia soli]
MTTIPLAGDAHVWVEEHGTGDLHVLSSAMGFSRYPAILAQHPTGAHVVTVQARGFGRSSRSPEPPAPGWLDQWADDVVAVADALGVDRFVYTGVSHGAGIGWHLARRHPDRLRALVSVVGTPHDRDGDTSSSAGRREIVANRRDPAVIEKAMRTIGGPVEGTERVALRDAFVAEKVAAFLAMDDEEARINQGMPYPDATDETALRAVLAGIDLPVLVIGGMRDGVISPQSTLRALTSVRGSVGVLFEDEGHFVADERPERLVGPITEFLAGLPVLEVAR